MIEYGSADVSYMISCAQAALMACASGFRTGDDAVTTQGRSECFKVSEQLVIWSYYPLLAIGGRVTFERFRIA